MNSCFDDYNSEIDSEISIYARPKQSLNLHFTNMIEQIPNIIGNKKFYFPSITGTISYKLDENLLKSYLEVIFSSHDYGKLSALFQEKIIRSMTGKGYIDKKCVPYSFHVQTSSLFAWIMLNVLLEDIKIEDGIVSLNVDQFESISCIYENLEMDNEDDEWIDTIRSVFEDSKWDEITFIRSFLVSVGSLVVLMHHNKGLSSDIDQLERKVRGLDIDLLTNDILINIKKNIENKPTIIDDIYLDLVTTNYWNDLVCKSINLLYQSLNYDYEDFFYVYTEYISTTLQHIKENALFLKTFYPIFFGFTYSSLCEADEWDAKSYIDNSKKHHIAFEPDRINLPNSLIDNFRIKKFNHTSDVNSNVSTSMQLINQIRNQLYSSSNLKISDLQSYKDSIFLMDAPTGSAKTLALLNVGIKLKNRILLEEKQQPRIIYALPFVSIIDQVGAVIQDILVSSQLLNAEEFGQNQLLTLHHHLADSKWIYLETDGLENSIINEGETKNTYTMHRVNTWHSEIIVTSFIKLFNTICKSHKRELIRFHRLAGSIILIDEVQGIPAQYWELIMQVFETLTKSLNCYIVLASATLPKVLLPASLNQVNLFDDKEINYPSLNRYNLFLDCYDIDIQDFITISINDFYKHLLTKFGNVLDNQYLIVVNTTRVAYSLYDSLHKKYDEGVFLLSTQILPIHRAVIISEISQRLKDNKPTILISTQLIEAGVDFSFKIVYRDFCPLDSIIQVAGRCNRNFEFDEPQEIRLVMLTENNGKIFYNLIYNQHLVNLNITTTLLKSINKQVISENELRNLSNNYFNSIAQIRVTNTLLEEYQQGRFETMNNNFSLIDNTYNQIPIVLMLDENKKFTKEYFHKKLKHIPNKLRPYTIEVSKSNLDTIISQIPETSFKCVKGKYDSTDIYFIQLTGENAKDIYTKQTGLKMVSFI